MRNKTSLIGSGEVLRRAIEVVNGVSLSYLPIKLSISVIQSICPLLSLLVMQQILNGLQGSNATMRIIVQWVIVYFLIDVTETCFSSLVGLYINKVELCFNQTLQKRVLEKVSRLQLCTFENSETYDSIRRAQYAENGTIIVFINTFFQILGSLIAAISYFAVLFHFNLFLFPVIVGISVIKYIVVTKINSERFQMLRSRTELERKKWYWSFLITNGNNIKDLKIYDLFHFIIDKYVRITKTINGQDYDYAKKSSLTMFAFSLIEQLLDAFIFLLIIRRGIAGTILVGSVVTYTRSVMQAKANIQNALMQCTSIQQYRYNVEQLFAFFDLEEEDRSFKNEIIEINSIEARNLSFRYPDNRAGEYALKNISFSFKRGMKIALVGENGSGKSTLLKVILGLYRDYEGQLLINGKDLKECNIISYQSLCSSLFQDFSKYEASVAENIYFANLKIKEKPEEVWRLINEFEVDKKINPRLTVEEVSNIQLGHWFADAKDISRGQWQRVALCRTFARPAELYTLDEPNTALDSISEKKLLKKCFELQNQCISIIVSHELSDIVRQVDQIVVLNEGSVISNGRHEELLESCELYRELYKNQEE